MVKRVPGGQHHAAGVEHGLQIEESCAACRCLLGLFSLDQHPTTITDLSWQCGGAQVEANYKVASGVSFWLGKCLAQSLKSCLAKRRCTGGFCPPSQQDAEAAPRRKGTRFEFTGKNDF